MKKLIKSFFVFIVMFVLLLTITGCAENEKSESSDNKNEKVVLKEDNEKDESTSTNSTENKKLVATKDGEDTIFGKYSETVEVTFRNKKADKIVMTRELEDEEAVKTIKEVVDSLNEDNSLKYEVSGNKVIITMDAEVYAEEEDIDEDNLTREKLKKDLEKDGYKVK